MNPHIAHTPFLGIFFSRTRSLLHSASDAKTPAFSSLFCYAGLLPQAGKPFGFCSGCCRLIIYSFPMHLPQNPGLHPHSPGMTACGNARRKAVHICSLPGARHRQRSLLYLTNNLAYQPCASLQKLSLFGPCSSPVSDSGFHQSGLCERYGWFIPL